MNNRSGDLGRLVIAAALVLTLIVVLRLGARLGPSSAPASTAELAGPSDPGSRAGPAPPPAPYLVTAFTTEGAPALDVFLELYEGPEPGDWHATSDEAPGGGVLARVAIPARPGQSYLVRIDSRTGAMGPYSIAFHRLGQALQSKTRAGLPDPFEPNDSWFQATTLVLDQSQDHSLSTTANPRGDEDWFVLTTP